MRYQGIGAAFLAAAALLSGCGAAGGTGAVKTTESAQELETQTKEIGAEAEETEEPVTNLPQIDNTKWKYNADDGVYWQVGISYCETPAAEEYETLGIFVPEVYLEGKDNGDGTYTCTPDMQTEQGGYTALTAPVVIPVNTPGYSAMDAPADYVSGAASYTDAGLIYVNAGCRGRNEGAPAGVTDLKAAVRYLRYNEGNIPGSMDHIFTFGMSGGGAQSALMGATGDSGLYDPYLTAIGAVQGVSDAVAGAMCWCPITNLDEADEAYEWNLGVSRTDLDGETKKLSDGLANAYAEYVNRVGLKDVDGTVLTLTESENGIYQAGTYYDYVKSEIERSLNNFLADTEFPYTPASEKGGPDGMGGHGGPEGAPAGGAAVPADGAGAAASENGDAAAQGGYVDENGRMQNDGIVRSDTSADTEAEQKTYETAQDYIDSLNGEDAWITYDAASNTAAVTSVADFVTHCKKAGKSVGAFDAPDASQGENTLFGYGDGQGAHFDPVMAELLKDTEYGESCAADLAKTDAQGKTVQERMNLYNPMYYLSPAYEGYRTSTPARYWRIRTGINQSDTALCTELNLTLALQNYTGLTVDFETVWGKGHTMAERTGSSTENFIQWVKECTDR